jgi:hypothetical protein
MDLCRISDEKFKTQGYADLISAIQMDATQPLPFPKDDFDAIFCMNSFNFYGGSYPGPLFG